MATPLEVSEGREFGRIEVHYDTHYRVQGSDDVMRTAQTKDVSGGGALFPTPELHDLGALLTLEIDVHGLDEPLQVTGEVMRVQQVTSGGYLTGVRFTDLDDQRQQQLANFLQLLSIRRLLEIAVESGASDIHLIADRSPIFRIDGKLRPLNSPALSKEDVRDIIYSILNRQQQEAFERDQELDFSFFDDQGTRFRVNLHVQRGHPEAALRRIDSKIRTLQELGLPDIITKLTLKPSGLVLITGGSGNGKTTTLAAMVDLINTEREFMVICLEDPLEYIHGYKKSIIKQREIGTDTASFGVALREALRQDPDVILVGEMRDAETISTAMTAAETGQLVLATIPAPGTTQAIDRIIDIFPAEQQTQIRFQLSTVLQGIIFQALLPRAGQEGRVLATEVLVATPAVCNLIREQQVEQIVSVIQTGQQHGMHTFDMSLKQLLQQGLIDRAVAEERAAYPQFLDA